MANEIQHKAAGANLSSAEYHATDAHEINAGTTGMILYENAGGDLQGLTIGSAGQVLVVAGGIPSWGASGSTNVTATAAFTTGDSLIRADGTARAAQDSTVTLNDAGTAMAFPADSTITVEQIQALDSDGLKLFEDGGTGITILNGGFVGIQQTTPTATLHVKGQATDIPMKIESASGDSMLTVTGDPTDGDLIISMGDLDATDNSTQIVLTDGSQSIDLDTPGGIVTIGDVSLASGSTKINLDDSTGLIEVLSTNGVFIGPTTGTATHMLHVKGPVDDNVLLIEAASGNDVMTITGDSNVDDDLVISIGDLVNNDTKLVLDDLAGTITFTGDVVLASLNGSATGITGAELETLSDGSSADALHTHTIASAAHTIASHSDTTATGAELETLTDNSLADTLHRHSELSGQTDGTPDQAVVVNTSGQLGVGVGAGATHALTVQALADDNVVAMFDNNGDRVFDINGRMDTDNDLLIKMGDVLGVNSGIYLEIDDAAQTAKLGDIDITNNGTSIFIDDSGETITIRADSGIATSGNITMANGNELATDKVIALDSGGLELFEDGGLGITITDSTGLMTLGGALVVTGTITLGASASGITGAELETLSDGSNADSLHLHSSGGSHNIADHADTSATGAELETLTDDSMADTLHRHSELSASDGSPNAVVAVGAAGTINADTTGLIQIGDVSAAGNGVLVTIQDSASNIQIDSAAGTLTMGDVLGAGNQTTISIEDSNQEINIVCVNGVTIGTSAITPTHQLHLRGPADDNILLIEAASGNDVVTITGDTDADDDFVFSVGDLVNNDTKYVLDDSAGTHTFTGDVVLTSLNGSATGITGAELEDLSDGGATVLHSHTSAGGLTIAARTGEAINKGQCVYMSGVFGSATPQVMLADNTIIAKSHLFGVAMETKGNNLAIEIQVIGSVSGFDTDGSPYGETWNEADELYMSTAGGLTNVIPTAGVVWHVGEVITSHTSAGEILVISGPTYYEAMPASQDYDIRMGDSAGTNKVSFEDYADNEVAKIDSNGLVHTDQVRALSAAGLSLFEDGGTGLFVENTTGHIGVLETTPETELEINGGSRIMGTSTTPTTSEGMEMFYSSSQGRILAFDRGGTAWKDMHIGVTDALIIKGGDTAAEQSQVRFGTDSPVAAADTYAEAHLVDTSGAYLTAGGAWTDAASVLSYKIGTRDVPAIGSYDLVGISDKVKPEKIHRRGAWEVLDEIRVADFEYKEQGKEEFTKKDGSTGERTVRLESGSGEVHRGFVLDTIPPEIGSVDGIASMDVCANNVVVLQEAKRRILELETRLAAVEAR